MSGPIVIGKKHPAATILFPRMTTAPSWIGDVGWNMLRSTSFDTFASSGVPISTKSFRLVSRSIPIIAPIFLFARAIVALIISSRDLSSSADVSVLNNFVSPIWASALLISG